MPKKRYKNMVQPIGQVIHNSKTTSSNSLLENNFSYSTRTNRTNSQKDNNFKVEYSSLIDTALVPDNWVQRHYKVIHKIGPAAYDALVYKAKRYGRNPQALLCNLINKELARPV